MARCPKDDAATRAGPRSIVGSLDSINRTFLTLLAEVSATSSFVGGPAFFNANLVASSANGARGARVLRKSMIQIDRRGKAWF